MEAGLKAELKSALALIEELSAKSSDSGLSEETCWELFGGPCPEALRKKIRKLEETQENEEEMVDIFASAESKLNETPEEDIAEKNGKFNETPKKLMKEETVEPLVVDSKQNEEPEDKEASGSKLEKEPSLNENKEQLASEAISFGKEDNMSVTEAAKSFSKLSSLKEKSVSIKEQHSSQVPGERTVSKLDDSKETIKKSTTAPEALLSSKESTKEAKTEKSASIKEQQSSQATGEKTVSKLGDSKEAVKKSTITPEAVLSGKEYTKAEKSASIKQQVNGDKTTLKVGDTEETVKKSSIAAEAILSSKAYTKAAKTEKSASIRQQHSSQTTSKEAVKKSTTSKASQTQSLQYSSELKVIKEPDLTKLTNEQSTEIVLEAESKLLSTIGIQKNGIHSSRKDSLSEKYSQTIPTMVKKISTSTSELSVPKLGARQSSSESSSSSSKTMTESTSSSTPKYERNKPCNCCCCNKRKIKLSSSASCPENKNYKLNIYTNNHPLENEEFPSNQIKITNFCQQKSELKIKKLNKRLQTTFPEKNPMDYPPAPVFCTYPRKAPENTNNYFRGKQKNTFKYAGDYQAETTPSSSSSSSSGKCRIYHQEQIPSFSDKLVEELQRRNNVKKTVDKFEKRCVKPFCLPYEQPKINRKRQTCNCCNKIKIGN